MMELSCLKDDTILIIPSILKDKVLEHINHLDFFLNIKIMTLDELKKKLYFDYNEATILYVMDKYHVKSSIAKIYLDNIYYIFDNNIDTKKAQFLIDLKEELIRNKLLIIDNSFELFLNRNFVVYGFDYIDKFNKKMLGRIKNINYINKPKYEEKRIIVREFKSLKDELEFVVKKICSLLDSGIDIDKIKLAGISSAYQRPLDDLLRFYHLPINIDNTCSIYSTKIVKEFIISFRECGSLEQAIEYIKTLFDLNNTDNLYIIQKLLDVANKFTNIEYSNDLILELIIDELKHIHTESIKYHDSIELVTIDNNYFSDEYIFILGLNEGLLPYVYKDEEFFSDKELTQLALDTSTIRNYESKKNFINNLYGIDNLFLSYTLSDGSNELYPSSIISDLDVEIIKENSDSSISWSETYDKIKLGGYLDDLIKYGELNQNTSLLYNNYELDYNSYNNSFTGINKVKLRSYIKSLNLSYTSLDQFYRCGFRYYINNILKLDPFKESFASFIGNLFHYILSICFNDGFDFDKEWDNYLLKRSLRVDESFFLIKLKKELLFIIDYLKEFNRDTGLNKMILEKKITVSKKADINVNFIGIIDKIMYREESDGTLISIIDYKTGMPNTNLFNSVYGIGMQLPVYLYLVVKSNIFNNPKMVGIYLQKILNNKDHDMDKKEALKLYGYSNNYEYYLERFDPTYENSKYIKNMKKTKNGFYHYTKIFDDKDIHGLVDMVDDKITSAVDSILNGQFTINPKRIGNVNEGCSYCTYRDLCFVKEEDIVNLKECNDFSFLRGDNNA